ncbi:MAG: sugar transferase [Nitrospirae bacterium]|nr:sugar transferase [Nitrospirota bacterium]MBI5694653.1 sugar transferase [Nitrospirota bacterium]
MLRERAAAISLATILTDVFIIIGCFVASVYIHSLRDGHPVLLYSAESLLAVLSGVLVTICMYHNEVYQSMRTKGYMTLVREVGVSYLQAFGIVTIVIFLFKVRGVGANAMLLYFFCSAPVVLFRRLSAKAVLSELRTKGYNFRYILVVGSGREAVNFAGLIEGYQSWGLRVMGFLAEGGKRSVAVGDSEYPVIGSIEKLDERLRTRTIDEVVFAATEEEMPWDKVRHAMYICEEYGVRVLILPKFFDMRLSSIRVEELGGLQMVTFETGNARLSHRMVKRVMDISVSLAALAVSGPVMAVIALLIKLDSPGPVLFHQKRCGMNGRVFDFLKFRSMRADAEKRKREIETLNEMSGPAFKMKDDPRITRIGKWIRKYSLDELPQLINVLKGDMSIVGPRPPLPSEVERYERWQRRRLSVRPGITCLWQVSGRNNIDFDDWVKLDLKYIDNWSLKLDLQLILRTIPTVFKGTGM